MTGLATKPVYKIVPSRQFLADSALKGPSPSPFAAGNRVVVGSGRKSLRFLYLEASRILMGSFHGMER